MIILYKFSQLFLMDHSLHLSHSVAHLSHPKVFPFTIAVHSKPGVPSLLLIAFFRLGSPRIKPWDKEEVVYLGDAPRKL